MVATVFSPCLNCGNRLPGIKCGPRQRSRCDKFLEYIRMLNRCHARNLLITELKALVTK